MPNTENLKPVCGIIMPISSIDGCSETHWADVMEILTEAIDEAGFRANIVSNADESGIIHKRIIQNLYDNPIVVCDVSGKNPNVMFELGMRLAFDKPTIIVKDDKTNYSFDTSQIEHISYPRDLRFSKIVEFKQKLSDKITSTYKLSSSDPNYTTFLKHFGEFTIAKIDKKEISGQEFILQELQIIRQEILDGKIDQRFSRTTQTPLDRRATLNICLKGLPDSALREMENCAQSIKGIDKSSIRKVGDNHFHLYISLSEEGVDNRQNIRTELRNMRGKLAPRIQSGSP